MLREGDRTPAFEPVGVEDGDIRTFRLTGELEADRVLLAFYPAEFSPDRAERCARSGTSTYCRSTTARGCRGRRRTASTLPGVPEAYDLQFPLLIDDLGEVAEAYSVLRDESDGHSRLAKRVLFLVDADRCVGYARATDDPAERPDLHAVRTVLDRERHGGNENENGNGSG